MPRQPRSFAPGYVYHLISRFVDREWFIQQEEERASYLALLGRALIASDWRCLAYAIMSNHIHLSMIAGADSLDSWIRRVHSPFANMMNDTYDRIGPMFVRGPKERSVSWEGVGAVIAYIHNNPVRAGVVDEPSKSTWTSHRAYRQLEPAPAWLHVDEGMKLAGFNDPKEFHRWVIEPERKRFDDVFEIEIENEIDAPVKVENVAIDPNRIVVAVALELGISPLQLCSRRRYDTEVIGRGAVVFCAQAFGLTGTQTARALQISPQAVSLLRTQGISTNAMLVGTRALRRLEAEGAASDVERVRLSGP